jgi:hypothetical protein
MGRQSIVVPKKVWSHLRPRLILLIGYDTLRKPSKKLQRRIQVATQLFLHDWAMSRSPSPLETLAGYRAKAVPLAKIPLALPNLNETKEVASWLRLSRAYDDALRRAEIIFKVNERRLGSRESALGKAFPQVPADKLQVCPTARDVALTVAGHLNPQPARKHAGGRPRSPATVARLLSTPARTVRALLDRERRANRSLDADLVRALRSIVHGPPSAQ